MTNNSGNIISNAAVRGHGGNELINLLSSQTTDLADVTDNNIFYQVLSSNVQILRTETSLNGHICSCKTMPIEPQTLVTGG